MIMLDKSSKEALERALTRAQENNLTVEWTGVVGSYRVSSASQPGYWHTVLIGKQNGIVQTQCTCPAHEFYGRICQHSAIALQAEKARLEAAHLPQHYPLNQYERKLAEIMNYCVGCGRPECPGCNTGEPDSLRKDREDLFGAA